jgi:hypothetical protein
MSTLNALLAAKTSVWPAAHGETTTVDRNVATPADKSPIAWEP